MSKKSHSKVVLHAMSFVQPRPRVLRGNLSAETKLEMEILDELNEVIERDLGSKLYYINEILQVWHIELPFKLMNLIDRINNQSLRDFLVRALGNPKYKCASEFCLRKYRSSYKIMPNENVYSERWTWGLTLFNICDKRYADDYLEIIKDESDSANFSQIILLLSKLKDERAIPIILNYLDYDWGGEKPGEKFSLNYVIVEALGNYKKLELKQYIEPFLTGKADGYIRQKARAAIKKIENANKKGDKK